MKKSLIAIICILSVNQLLAGGLVTNTNQSARFTRMLWRDATLGVDAVYYNPAGLARFEEGLYLSFNNQTVTQTQTINNNYRFLNDSLFDYTGTVKAPFFPSAYVAYKIGKIVFSGGFNPIGGGGGATFADGLPSFETMVSDLVPMLQSQLAPLDQTIISLGAPDPGFRNVTGYDAEIFFEGSSIYFGYQANMSYEVSDKISLGIGARFVSAKNTYQGHVKNVTIDAPSQFGGTQSPGNYLRTISSILPLGDDNPVKQNLIGTANALDQQTNLEADVVRKGNGVTPIFSLNIEANDQLNLSVKYEFKTKLELATTVNDGKDAGGMFTDGEAVVADMPALLVIGGTFKPNEKLLLSTGFHYYFDKNNDYDGSLTRDIIMIDNNSFEYGLGLEYSLNNMLNVSAGWLGTRTGVNDLYQSDQRFSLNTQTFGGGFGIKILDQMDLDLGGSYTFYQDGFRGYTHSLGGQNIAITENYDKATWVVAVGLNFYFEY